MALLVPLLAAMALVSVTHQATTWKMAASLSRRGIQAFAPLVDQGLTTVYLPALPYWFAEGPFVLKSYAFGFYYAGRDVPAVRTHDMVVTRLGNRAIFGGWKDAAPQTALGPKVTIHDLGLPVSGMPTRLSLDPTRVSLLQTANSRPGGGSLIALDGPATVRWSIDIPAGAPIAITPAQGDGQAGPVAGSGVCRNPAQDKLARRAAVVQWCNRQAGVSDRRFVHQQRPAGQQRVQLQRSPFALGPGRHAILGHPPFLSLIHISEPTRPY